MNAMTRLNIARNETEKRYRKNFTATTQLRRSINNKDCFLAKKKLLRVSRLMSDKRKKRKHGIRKNKSNNEN
jgi:hypothetical protein